MTAEHLKKRIAVANQQIPADLVIKNGRIIDVFNLEIITGDLAIADGMIVGIGAFEGHQVIDAKNRYVSPALIDGHVHIESSMVTPSEFAKVVLPHGVTTVITDPHEIANVSGIDGIRFMMEDAEHLSLNVYFMLPSCVPATPFENSGSTLLAHDLEALMTHEKVLGLAEVMDYPSLRNAEKHMIDKFLLTFKNNKQIDGHLAGLETNAINTYRTSGVLTDHECTTVEEALERLRRGMYLLIREGSVAKDLNALLPVVTSANARRCLFCTDDKHLDDLIQEGSIDHNIRLAIRYGLDPLLAIQMGSLNAAECYGLKDKGALAPGYSADFLLIDDLASMTISEVYKNGECIAQNGTFIEKEDKKPTPPPHLMSSVTIPTMNEDDLRILIGETKQAHIIEIIPNQLNTIKLQEEVTVSEGHFVPSLTQDQLKIAVVERHHHTGNIGLGIVKGFGLQRGAIATTIAHDSHNIVCTGTNDQDMLVAIQTLQDIGGGLVISQEGKVVSALPLPIAGLMTNWPHLSVNDALKDISVALKALGFKGKFNPFLTLSFLTLPVIPALKLTDLGLFDVEQARHIPVQV
ncbi:adenine deaminase [Pullulanibacillus pueri]|uniref:Adenine deaminase n=1 Tax=Pullulanibacillus pueri TaxID=1437324 RepID=A0A8J2ZYJ5_9BACL|nr:adenine deaminase [Pullulanibacillus pueri]MBM7682935.1 adenine deaminase [Pullulanibacillus pueri]GGH84740.1 adenine deaminase [Pullulanibacillus pueri]